jgi:hypothetical protein
VHGVGNLSFTVGGQELTEEEKGSRLQIWRGGRRARWPLV